MPESKRVAAVVVTYNRIELLQPLLERLDTVSGLAEVIVVDNASTDGTTSWLASVEQQHRAVPVVAHTLARNSGGAGGFHDGLRLAMERGADLAWLMDDDGLPEPDCLDQLLKHADVASTASGSALAASIASGPASAASIASGSASAASIASGSASAASGLDFWGPLVVDKDQPSRLVFPIRLPGRAKVVHDLPDVEAAAEDGLIRDIVIPFNGVLVTRELVERIGLPRKEFFIWGDDHEYRLRAEKAGARIATVVGAKVHHPAVGDLGTPMLGGRSAYNHTPSDLKHYCMARNNLLNLRDYRGWPFALAFVAKTLWFYLVTKPMPARIVLSAQAWVAAIRGDFSGHERFLR